MSPRPPTPEFGEMDARTLQRALACVQQHTGIQLSTCKQTMLQARLRPRLRSLQLADYRSYLQVLSDDERERQPFIEAVTTHQTSFFRTAPIWRHLGEDFLPRWHTENAGRRLEVWSAAASTGEEVCSMAMCCEEARRADLDVDYHIVGTDISLNVLATAQAGHYAGPAVSQLRRDWPELFYRYNVAGTDDRFRLSDQVRRRLQFAGHNLMDGCPWPARFDVIFLRNVLIYFSSAHIGQIVRALGQGLREGGLLVIGESESLSGHDTPFDFVEPHIYRKR